MSNLYLFRLNKITLDMIIRYELTKNYKLMSEILTILGYINHDPIKHDKLTDHIS